MKKLQNVARKNQDKSTCYWAEVRNEAQFNTQTKFFSEIVMISICVLSCSKTIKWY